MDKKIKLNKAFFEKIKIMAECQNDILEIVSRPTCIDDDQVAVYRYWEICEVITDYNQKVEKYL